MNELIKIEEENNQLKLKPQMMRQQNNSMSSAEIADYIWDVVCQRLPSISSEKKEKPSNRASQSFTHQDIANQSCIDNFLTREIAQHALRQININPALIQDSSDTCTYYTNMIQYLISRGQLENWLRELSKERMKFAQEWLEKLGRFLNESYTATNSSIR